MKINDMIKRIIQLQNEAVKRDDLAMWTVYDHPLDFPDKVVARLFTVGREGMVATEHVIVADRVEDVTDILENAGLVPLARKPDDDPKIVMTWL